METGVSDARTLRNRVSSEIALVETLDATRVAELAKWWRKRVKALRKESSPALAEDQARKELRATLVEMVQESALDTEIGRVVRAAAPKKSTTEKPATKRRA
jgi:hypothetical protein